MVFTPRRGSRQIEFERSGERRTAPLEDRDGEPSRCAGRQAQAQRRHRGFVRRSGWTEQESRRAAGRRGDLQTAHGARIGTPAFIIASEPPPTEAIELEPLDSRMSETIRIVYGKSS
jgi:hypothetical protein